MIIPRWAMHELLAQLETHRVVSVVGCRQSGKTTILLTTPLPNVKFQSLDVQANFSAAIADPSYFVRRTSPEIFVIDEIQKVPQLIGEIKFQVDRNPEKGQYIISGRRTTESFLKPMSHWPVVPVWFVFERFPKPNNAACSLVFYKHCSTGSFRSPSSLNAARKWC